MSAPDVNVVTVENPGAMEIIEIRPTEILQVIFTGRDDAHWTMRKTPEDHARPRLQGLRHETYYNDGMERSNKRGNFQIVPMTDRIGDPQSHMWFRVDPADYEKVVANLGHQEIEIANLTFSAGRAVIGRLKVILVVDAPARREYTALMEQTVWTGKDLIKMEAMYAGVGARLIDEDGGYILNPSMTEQVIFETNQKMMLVEVAEPHGTNGGMWDVRGVSSSSTGNPSFKLKELCSRVINGRSIQRIIVGNLMAALPRGVERMRLGVMKLTALDELGNELPRQERTVHFWVTERREIDTEFFDNEFDEDDGDILTVEYTRGHSDFTPSRPVLTRSLVKIEEIMEDLTTGVRLIQVFPPKPLVMEQSEVVDPPDDTWIMHDENKELVIHLYRDGSCRPPEYKVRDWCLKFHGDALALCGIVSDDHRQRFLFKKKDIPQKSGETLLFTCGHKVKKLHVSLIRSQETECEPCGAD
jgi:hypothetical protein